MSELDPNRTQPIIGDRVRMTYEGVVDRASDNPQLGFSVMRLSDGTFMSPHPMAKVEIIDRVPRALMVGDTVLPPYENPNPFKNRAGEPIAWRIVMVRGPQAVVERSDTGALEVFPYDGLRWVDR